MTIGRSRRAALAAAGLAVALVLAGCDGSGSGAGPEPTGPTPSPTVPTITMITVPPDPPSGRVDAEITQSSHDRAHGRVQVLLSNGTDRTVHPRRIVYTDARLTRPIAAGRLRALPPGGHRQYPVPLPPPVCGAHPRVRPQVTLSSPEAHVLPVSDENDDIGTYVEAACFEELVERSVRVRLGAAIPRDTDRPAHLVVSSRAVGSMPVRLLTMLGTPLFAPAIGSGAWRPGALLGAGPIRLPVVPARCDPHSFGEGGEMTVFAVTMSAGTTRGSFKLALSTRDKRAIYAYALAHCGLDG